MSVLLLLIFYRKLRHKDISKVHIQLCLSLFLSFLISTLSTLLYYFLHLSPSEGCWVLPILWLYASLVFWMWAGAEALYLFLKVVIIYWYPAFHITTKLIITISTTCWSKSCCKIWLTCQTLLYYTATVHAALPIIFTLIFLIYLLISGQGQTL